MSAETLLCDPVLRHGWDVYLCFQSSLVSNPIEIDGFKMVKIDHFPNCGNIAIIKIACKGTENFSYMQIILHNYNKTVSFLGQCDISITFPFRGANIIFCTR